MITAVLLAAALQTLSPGASSPAPSLASQAAPAAPVVAKDPMVCRRTPSLGSRLGGEKVCMTKSQWAARELQDAQNVRDMQSKGFQNRPQ